MLEFFSVIFTVGFKTTFWRLQMTYEQYLNLSEVSVIKKGSIFREEGNSQVYSMPIIRLSDFVDKSSRELAVNNIIVNGRLNEGLHFHKTNIIALVTYGRGRILSEKEGSVASDDIEIGDLVIIPAGALHAFESNENEIATYAVLEFGEEVDYQKHYYTT